MMKKENSKRKHTLKGASIRAESLREWIDPQPRFHAACVRMIEQEVAWRFEVLEHRGYPEWTEIVEMLVLAIKSAKLSPELDKLNRNRGAIEQAYIRNCRLPVENETGSESAEIIAAIDHKADRAEWQEYIAGSTELNGYEIPPAMLSIYKLYVEYYAAWN